MASSIQLFIISAVLATVLGQNNNIDRVTNGTQDYLKLAQAELLYKIKIAELENEAVDARFLDRLTVIEQQQQEVLNETQQVNQVLIPLQALNLIRKYCIQTYDSQLIAYQTIKERSKTCINRAQATWANLQSMNKAKSYTELARSWAVTQLPLYLSNCQSYYNNQTRFEECYVYYVQKTVDNVQINLNSALLSREQSIFEMNGISLTAVQCSYEIEKDVLATITLTSQKIDDCVEELSKKSGVGNRKALH